MELRNVGQKISATVDADQSLLRALTLVIICKLAAQHGICVILISLKYFQFGLIQTTVDEVYLNCNFINLR